MILEKCITLYLHVKVIGKKRVRFGGYRRMGFVEEYSNVSCIINKIPQNKIAIKLFDKKTRKLQVSCFLGKMV